MVVAWDFAWASSKCLQLSHLGRDCALNHCLAGLAAVGPLLFSCLWHSLLRTVLHAY